MSKHTHRWQFVGFSFPKTGFAIFICDCGVKKEKMTSWL